MRTPTLAFVLSALSLSAAVQAKPQMQAQPQSMPLRSCSQLFEQTTSHLQAFYAHNNVPAARAPSLLISKVQQRLANEQAPALSAPQVKQAWQLMTSFPVEVYWHGADVYNLSEDDQRFKASCAQVLRHRLLAPNVAK